jgi:hypothetical protein
MQTQERIETTMVTPLPPPSEPLLPVNNRTKMTATAAAAKSPPAPTKGVEDDDDKDHLLPAVVLSEEVWMFIMRFLDPSQVILEIPLLSHRFASLVNTHSYWRYHARMFLEVWDEHQMQKLSLRQLQRCCLYAVRMLNDTTSDNKFKLKSLVPFREAAESIRHQTAAYEQQRRQQQQNRGATTTLARRVCLASSTDHPTEILEHVLTPVADIVPHPQRGAANWLVGMNLLRKWWSSQPSATPDTSEELLFALNCPLAMIRQVSLKPLRDPYTHDRTYTWNTTDIRVYRLPLYKLTDPSVSSSRPGDRTSSIRRAGFPCTVPATATSNTNNNHNDNNHNNLMMDERFHNGWNLQVDSQQDSAALHSLLHKEIPIYECHDLPTTTTASETSTTTTRMPQQQEDDNHRPPARVGGHNNNNTKESHTLPTGVIGNVVVFTLHGKHRRQFETSGYYTCLEHVSIEGVPLIRPND